MSDTYLTRAGYEKLVSDLEGLKKQKNILSREIGEAAEKGDLRENADYHEAKKRQAEILRRIHELEDKLKKARLIDDLKIPKNEVQIGVKVTLLDKEDGDEMEWTLVGADEANPSAGKLSVYAPLAQGILGKKVGDEVIITLPAGPRKYKILKTQPGL
ncbi:MAG: transcription elongation factor GreA [Elusimicrobia bacterium]|nr:transcription elongation factor GreA [Elusimicrobiota bacterium]